MTEVTFDAVSKGDFIVGLLGSLIGFVNLLLDYVSSVKTKTVSGGLNKDGRLRDNKSGMDLWTISTSQILKMTSRILCK